MELRHLRYLVAVAEERHFGRAAGRLYISQPSLSYTIRALERELGVALLARNSRSVTLTDAGRDVLAEARRTLHHADRVLDAAERHRLGQAGRLLIGFQASGAGRLTTAAHSLFSERHPGVRVEPKGLAWGEETAALRDGRVDVAFVWLPVDTVGLRLEVVAAEARYVGMAVNHPLAGRAGVSIMDLRDEPVMWSPKAPKSLVDWMAVNPRPDGSEPVWGPSNENVEECLEQVAAGAAVCFSPASMASYYARPDLTWIRILDVEPLRIALGWVEEQETPLVEEYARIVRELAAGELADLPA